MATTLQRLHAALAEADFPAEKSDLVRWAEHSETDADTLRELNAMPPVVYNSMGEVERSVFFDAGVSAQEEAARRRTHDKPLLAEEEKEIPSHPIVDELGENRGS